jgi:transcription initiation factor TFIIIB Brf1 subunit/transcription initiation factor TFIIB
VGGDRLNTAKKLQFNPFAADDDELENEPERKTRAKMPKLTTVHCTECDVEMYKSPAQMAHICPECGKIDEIVGSNCDVDAVGNTENDIVNNYNTSSDSAAPVRITGPNAYAYQKKFVSNTSNYKKTQRRTTIDQMINTVYQYQGNKIPDHVVREAAEFYYEVQQHRIKRGDVRRGAMAACLYRKCKEHNITRKPKEIANIFNIQQNELSNGEKILDDLQASGCLDKKHTAPIANDDNALMQGFLNQYFEALHIPNDDGSLTGHPNYRYFAERLIRFTRKYHIATSSIISSACAGAIYIIAMRCKELNIKREMIERECDISKSTFGRFSEEVKKFMTSTDPKRENARSRLRRVFKESRIPIK